MSRSDIIERMESKYRDELDLYRILHGVCLEQKRAAEDGLVEEVVRLARVKSELMKQINALESEIQALRSHLGRTNPDPRDLHPPRHKHQRQKGLA